MDTLVALREATKEWILFDDQKRFVLKTHRKPLSWEVVSKAIQEHKDLYAGIKLHHDLKILCVDIDARETPLTESQAKEYIKIFEELLGATCIPELSKNNGLHLFFKYLGNLPESGREKGIQNLDIPHTVEWYWHNQAILITNKNLAPWRDWTTLTPTHAETITKLFPQTQHQQQTQHTTKTKKKLNTEKDYTKRKNAWFELLPLLPELHTPLYASRIVREDHEKIYLRRPQKYKEHSAVLFKNTGVFYNFSTNWQEVGVQEAIPTESFILRHTQKTTQQLGKIIHQFIQELFTQNNIPIPRRKRYNYYTIKRKQLRELYIIEALLNKKTLSLQQIEKILNQKLRYKTHPATIHRDLETLTRKRIITKIKTPNKSNQYTLQTNPITALLYDTILSQNYTQGTKLLLYTAFLNLTIPTITTETQPLDTIYNTFNQFKNKYQEFIKKQSEKIQYKIKLQPQYHQPSINYQKHHKKYTQTQQYQQLNQQQKNKLNQKTKYFVQITTQINTTNITNKINQNKKNSNNKNSNKKQNPNPNKNQNQFPPRISFKPQNANNQWVYFLRFSLPALESYKRLLWWWWRLGSSP